MSLKTTKLYFEQLFADNWDDTPIHFTGQDFDASSIASWINVIYNPSHASNSGISGVGKRLLGSVTVVCWAETDADVMELADTVIDFMNNNVSQNEYSLNGYNVEDHAWHESNSVYIYLTFSVTSYIC